MVDISSQQSIAPLIIPMSVPSCALDDKNRLRLPTEFKRYLEKVTDNEYNLWITSLNGQSVRVYPRSWWENTYREIQTMEPSIRKTLTSMGRGLGADGKLDDAGRITIHQQLMQFLKWDKSRPTELRIAFNKNCFELTPADVFEAELRLCVERAPAAIEAAELLGIL
jgi:DNA-binding transcriptional regulator/RsmH inhibitor MraZ